MKEERQMEEPLRDLIDIIHFTENVSAKIHGVLDEAEIYRIVREEFLQSERYAASILLLTPDGSKLEIGEASVSSRKVKEGEKAAGLRLREYKIDLKKSSIHRQVVREGKTLQASTRDIIGELLPRPLADLISKIMGYDEKRAAILTPLKRHGEITGVFAMSSTELAEHFIPSVRNLALHISNALELAGEYAERKRAERKLKENESRYRSLFEDSPIALWEEDWSQIKEYVDELRASGVTDFYTYFHDHPEAAARCFRLTRVLDVNRATLDLMEAEDREDLLSGMERVITEESLEVYPEQLAALAEGYGYFESEAVSRTLLGEEKHTLLQVSVPPGYEDSLGKVLVSMLDITERKRAEEELKRRSEELATLNVIASTVAGSLHLEDIMNRALDKVLEAMKVEAGVITLSDPETGVMTLVTHRGLSDEFVQNMRSQRQKVSTELANTIPAGEEAILIQDLPKDPRGAAFGADFEKERLRSSAAVSLQSKGDVVGMLAVISREPHNFTAQDVELLTSIGSQIGVAIENANVYHEEMQRVFEMEALRKTTLDITSQLDMPQLLRSIVERAAALVGTKAGGLYLYHAEDEELELVVSYNMDRDYAGTRLGVGEGLSGKVVQTGEPIIVEDYASWEGKSEIYEDAPLRAILGVPLKWGEKIVGVLNVNDLDRSRTFTDRELWLLEQFASQAAIAIENARLYEEQERRSQELMALHETSLHLVSQLDLDSLLDAIMGLAMKLLNGKTGDVYLYRPRHGDLTSAASQGVPPELERAVVKVGEGIAGTILRTGEPLIVDDYDSWEGRAEQYSGYGFGRVVGVPMKYGEDFLGALVVERELDSPLFTQEDVNLLRLFADQAALAIENAGLYEETAQKAEELAAVYDVSLDVVGQLELSSLLETIVQRAIDLLRVDTGGLYLYDPEREELELTVHEALVTDLRGIRVSLGEGLSGKVAQSGEPLVVMDYGKWQEKSPHFDDGRSVNAFAIPIKRGNTLLGVLYFADEDLDRRFDESDVRLATLFANQAAVAIENARLYQETARRAEELATLYDVSLDVAGQLELQSLLETILQRAIDLLTGHAGGLYLYDEEGRELELTVHHGLGRDYTGVRLALGEGLCGKVAETGEPLTVMDYTSWEGRSPLFEHEHAVSSLGVPIKRGNTLLGALWVDDPDTKREFGETDIRLASLFANQAAVAIENARLYEETERRLKETTTLQEVSRLVNSSLEPEQIFQTLVETVASAFSYDLVNIYILEEAGLRLGAQVGYDPSEALDFIALDKGVSGRVALSGEAELIQDVSKDPDFLQAAPGIVSEITVPIKKDHHVLGILGVESAASEPLTEADLNLVSSISHQVSVAIQNARLYEETKRRLVELSVLYEASVAAASTLEFSEILERVVGVLRGTLGFSNLTVMLLDKEEQRLKIEAGMGYVSQVAEQIQPRLGEGITGCVAMTGEPQNVPDVTKDPRYIMGDENMRSELCVPLEVGDKIIGVLNIESSQVAAFSDDDLRLLSTLAGQLAMVIENARLYEEAQQELAERKRAEEELQQSYARLQRALEQTVDALAAMAEKRDPYTAGHQQGVVRLAVAVAKKMGLSQERIEGIRVAATVHDIGKIYVPAEILSKPGPLSDIELDMIKFHPQAGYDVLKTIEFPWPVGQVVLQHHERIDGSGYPQGLSGEGILLEAKIVAVADVVEAMASHRPHRAARSIDEVLEEIRQNRGVSYDPEVVDACLRLFAEDPTWQEKRKRGELWIQRPQS
jgi:GAF domain-containing protein